MLQGSNKEKPNNGNFKGQIELIWDNPIGKVGLTAAGIISLMVFMAAFLKVGAVTVNAYKDFRDAAKR